MLVCVVNIGVALAFHHYAPMWIAAPFILNAALSITYLITFVMSPEQAFRIKMTISWYVWKGIKPVVRFVVGLFCSREAVGEFVELMDDIHDTLAGRNKD